MSINTIKNWWLAARPKTLMAAICPVLIASAMAFGDGIHHFPTAFLCLTGALLIQVGTNLANDYFDFKKGVDTDQRVGPKRVTQSGLIKPDHVRIGFIIVFALTLVIALLLVNRGGVPVILLAVMSIICGILYTAGPYPLGYNGLGDIFVLIFFGPVAVGYTYYLQSYEINGAVFLAGFAPGLLSNAILTVNNLRDLQTDSKSGKRTLAVRWGKVFAYYEYLLSLIGAIIIPIVIFLLINDHRWIMLASFSIFPAIPAIIRILTENEPSALNPLLGYTGKILFIYSVLFSIGWII